MADRTPAATIGPSPPSSSSDADQLSAAEARSGHSIVSALGTGWRVWYALLGSLAAWIIHLLAFVSLARLSTDRSWARWAMHGITVLTLAMVAASMLLSWRLTRSGGDASDRDEAGRNRFIGQLGLLFGTINAALILLEELYLNIIRRSGVA